ncbi:CvpA family protein [Deferrisoma camini]|uniref:CvpA family protein n=1 Tax=Deferrisoma camini TaxID=1035120 RepID=UPI00046CC4B0|nr:CvpA family protein [Deferrisoma camini]
MNPFDLFVLVLAGLLLLAGIWKGAVRQIAGFAGVILGAGAALRYHGELARLIPWGAPATRELIAFSALLVGAIAAAFLVGWAISRLLGAACLGWLDRTLGAALGLVKAIVVAATVGYFLAALLPARSTLIRRSVTLPYALRAAETALELLPPTYRRPVREGRQALRRLGRGI